MPIRRTVLCRVVIAVGLGLAGAESAYGQASITPMAPADGGSSSAVFGLSRTGGVAVGHSGLPGHPGLEGAVCWDGEPDAPLGLGALPGGVSSSGRGVDASGRVVGGVSQFPGGSRGFAWDDKVGMRVLRPLHGHSRSHASGVSADGMTMIGYSDSPEESRAVRWDADGGVHELDGMAGAAFSTATGVNGDGTVIVGVRTAGAVTDAFAWRAGAVVSLAPLAGGAWSSAAGVSADGRVVVGTSDAGGGRSAAVRWLDDAEPQDLGTPQGGWSVIAHAVSADGAGVVGHTETPGGPRATYWTAAVGMVDLNTYLPTLGVDLDGWELTHAHAISGDGAKLGGAGMHNGAVRGWVVTLHLPTPGAGASVLLIMLTTGRRSRPAHAAATSC